MVWHGNALNRILGIDLPRGARGQSARLRVRLILRAAYQALEGEGVGENGENGENGQLDSARERHLRFPSQARRLEDLATSLCLCLTLRGDYPRVQASTGLMVWHAIHGDSDMTLPDLTA